ncbi:MAG: hypothetical protein ACYC96_09790 [Fimbriimonadaceae bacterium]
MVQVSIEDGALVCEVEGMHKIWACKSRLVIALEHVVGVQVRSEETQSWWHGWKMIGADIPGVFAAGVFKMNGKWVFWDVRHPENAIEIDLRDETYSSLWVEVEDPGATAALIQSAIRA